MSLAALLSSVFGVMLEPLQQEFGWTRAQISSGPAIVSVMGLFLATPAGYLIDRFGTRPCGIVVVLTSCAAIASMGAIGSLWHWWAAWALFGIAGAFTSTVWLAPVSTIFQNGRGLAIAVTVSGTGISTALAPGIAEYFVQNQGWRSGFLALAALWCVPILPLILAFVPRRARLEARDSEQAARNVAPALTGLTPRQGFASPTLYLLFFASLLSAMTGVALVLNLVPVLTDSGLSRANAIAIIGSMGVASIIGRICGGILIDRFDARRIGIAAALVSLGLPLALLLFPGNPSAALFGVIAFGATGGVKMNAIVYLVSARLGTRSFGLFYSMISITMSIAQGIGPLLANHVYDLTGSYRLVIWSLVPGFAGAALLLVALGSGRAAPSGDVVPSN